jgi:hypothetical protein
MPTVAQTRNALVTRVGLGVAMTTDPPPGLAGALLIRAWVERESGQLRLTLTARSDVTSPHEEHHSAATIEDAMAYSRGWLAEFAESHGALLS